MRYGIRQSCLPPHNGLPVVLRNRGMGELLQKTFDKEGGFEYISHPAAVERPIRAHLRRDLAQFCDLVEVWQGRVEGARQDIINYYDTVLAQDRRCVKEVA
jgi:hypothetical protein